MFIRSLAIFLVSLPLMAVTQHSTEVYDIDLGRNNTEEVLILLNSGHVAKIPSGKSEILSKLMDKKNRGQTYNFVLDDERYIVKMEPVPKSKTLFLDTRLTTPSQYVPTTVASLDIARQYHKEARYNPKDSQCFNRAMVWTYEWWRKHSLKSNKILIYFSRTYIRRYNFEWWFHIAPYIHVLDNGKVVERVLDVKYGRGPLEFRRWTNLFMRNDVECMVVTKFSEYADYPYTGECYIQRTNMYTYQPADLQMLEAWGYTKDKFNMNEVRQAYLEAFDERI